MPKKKIIIALAGKIASGKDTASDYLVKKYSGKKIKFSTSLRDMLDRFFLEQSRNNQQKLSRMIRKTFGQDILAKTVAKEAELIEAELVVIDGVRRPKDVEYLKKVKGYYLVAIDAPDEMRYKRITSRNENPDDNTKTWEEFQEQENADAEKLIPEIMKQAKFTVTNADTPEDFYKQIDEVYKKIIDES